MTQEGTDTLLRYDRESPLYPRQDNHHQVLHVRNTRQDHPLHHHR